MKRCVVAPVGEDTFLLFKCDLLIIAEREEFTDRDTSDLTEPLDLSECFDLEGRPVLEVRVFFDVAFDVADVSDFEESSDIADMLDFVESSDMMEIFA